MEILLTIQGFILSILAWCLYFYFRKVERIHRQKIEELNEKINELTDDLEDLHSYPFTDDFETIIKQMIKNNK